MHGPALGLAEPGRLAHQLGETLLGRRAARHRVVVTAIGGEHVVVGAKRRARPHGDRLVTGGEVSRALHQPGKEKVVGGLLGEPDDHHLFVELEQLVVRVSHRAPGRLVLPTC